MARILSDHEIEGIIGTVIVDGDPVSIRPNSYVLRLGSEGEFMNTGKEFALGEKKKGIRVQPGHSVGVTALETLDFRRETVGKIFEERDLHGIISPTTDLSREGVVAATTQVDAGYYGTLNWTLTNTSSEERRFVYGERLFRLTILLLEEGERPRDLYEGDYQDQTGYIRSRRHGPPVGMKETEWEEAIVTGGPEDLLESLIKSGYPWHALGQRLKVIDQQFKAVSDEYSDIHDSIAKLTGDFHELKRAQQESPETVRRIVQDEASSLQNRWLIGAGSLLVGSAGVALSVASNQTLVGFLSKNGYSVGVPLVLLAGVVLFVISKSRSNG